MTQRNKTVDLIRAIAVIWIIVYHTFAIACGQGFFPRLSVPVIQELVIYGGEIGVTLFFIMSGYGLYCSLDRAFESNKFCYGAFLKKRWIRVMPQYYIHLFVVLLLGSQAGFLSRVGFKHIITHLLFIHNLFPETARTISGTLWTMGTIVQFYFFAPLIYKVVRKNKYITLVCAVLFTIAIKYFVFHILKVTDYGDLGREIYTAIDNFVVGMFIASLAQNLSGKINTALKICLFTGAVIGLVMFLLYSNNITVYSDTIIGYVWHSLLAIILSLFVFIAAVSPIKGETKIAKLFLLIADNEYGIYLYQLVIIENVLANSGVFRFIASKSIALVTMTLIVVTSCAGIVSTKCTNWIGKPRNDRTH